MRWFEKLKQPKIFSMALVMATLVTGIVIGTLISTGVRAEKGGAAPDATPLSIPSPVQLANDFTELAKKMEPTVVFVNTTFESKQKPTAERKRRNEDEEEESDPQMDLFRRFFRGPMPDMPPRRREGSGSGFIVDPKGYIITNHHVVDSAEKIVVKLHGDQTDYKAKLIGFDVETDLAVIKIDAGKSLPFAPVGNSDAVQVGDWAVAIGSPFGLEASVTAGIVSAKGRNNVGQQFQSFIQTDAAINPGNSGGPLLNIKGQVIGVNTMIATSSGGYQGIGFALPVNTAVGVYNQIIKNGRVTRGSIGITMSRAQDKPETLRALGAAQGVIVEAVQSGGPAARAGLKAEDIILSINGKPVKDGDDLVARVAATPIGDKLRLTIDRAGKKLDLDVAVGDRAEVFKDDPRYSRFRKNEEGEKEPESAGVKFGFFVGTLSAAEREEMKIDADRGIKVTRVAEDSFAAEVGLQANDVILSINRQAVSSTDDIRKIQSGLKPGDAVAFRVVRAQQNPLGRGAPRYAQFFVSGTLPKN
ncbi:MAG: Do family serine endopeptidase [Acidobacteria bacterium]|nr:Do family serine endopeptidase [Acidobacteriota bacterium]